jgi:flagellar hook assembly protein FlgD
VAMAIPVDFVLESNYPNPFNPSTVIRYGLPEPASVSVIVYSVLGQEVARLEEGFRQAGTYEVTWDGHSSSGSVMSTGVYLYRMAATGTSGKNYMATKRMVLVK